MNTIKETAKRTITILLFFPRFTYIKIPKITIRIKFTVVNNVNNISITI